MITPNPLHRLSHYWDRGIRYVNRGLENASRRRAQLLKLMKWRWQLPEYALPQQVRLIPLHEPILEQTCMPPHFGGQHHDDFNPLLKIAAFLQPSRVIEFGTAHGNTVANICRQCPETHVYTVNALPEQLSGSVITFALRQDDIGCVFREHGFADRVTQIYSDTLTVDLGEYLQPASVELAIIDACHDTSYVVNDFHRVAPFIAPGGVVLLHDTHPSLRGHLQGSYLACMQLRSEGYDVRHLENTWWGIWVNAPDFAMRSAAAVTSDS